MAGEMAGEVSPLNSIYTDFKTKFRGFIGDIGGILGDRRHRWSMQLQDLNLMAFHES